MLARRSIERAPACGEPFLKDLLAIERIDEGGRLVTTSFVEEWAYANPKSEDPRVLRFEASRLVGSGARCAGGIVEKGSTKVEVLLKCGDPVGRELLSQTTAPRAAPGSTPMIDKRVEQWSYRMGKGQFTRLLTFREGRVSAIDQGQRE